MVELDLRWSVDSENDAGVDRREAGEKCRPVGERWLRQMKSVDANKVWGSVAAAGVIRARAAVLIGRPLVLMVARVRRVSVTEQMRRVLDELQDSRCHGDDEDYGKSR